MLIVDAVKTDRKILGSTKEIVPLALGVWKDRYIYQDGSFQETSWKNNQIQDYSATIAARLISKSVTGESSATNGFIYLALGEGLASWDVTPPTLDVTSTTLQTEIDRISIISATDIVYLDPATLLQVAGPTRMVQATVLIDWNRGIGSLREFGLVVGDATSVAGTGELFNWVQHSVITKAVHPSPMQILRTIRIKWLIPSEVTVL